MAQGPILNALNTFLARVESIDRTIDLRDRLIVFGQDSPDGLLPAAAELHFAVRAIGQAGMQPSLDGAVLLLAAALEQFVSDLIIAFASTMPTIVPVYDHLPERLRSANENMTGEALSARGYRNRFTDYDVQRFVHNLSSCRSGIGLYALNGEVLALHGGNLNPETLVELMGRLGVPNVWPSIGSIEAMKEWSEQENANTAGNLARNQLKELIDTRNQIAHSVGSATPGPDIIRSFIRFERALSQALVGLLHDYGNSLSAQEQMTSQH